MKSDPREFESEEQYSDFDENDHIDLLAPTEMISSIVYQLQEQRQLLRLYISLNLLTCSRLSKQLII